MRIIKNYSLNEEVLNLLLQANPDKGKVLNEYNQSTNYIFMNNNKVIGVILLDAISNENVEILNLSIKEDYQGKGYGKKFLNTIFNILENEGYKKIQVGTGNSSLRPLAFYQKLGFRIISIKKNYFIDNYTEDIYENTIQCVDLLMLEKNI